jgi:hypothetical protein
MIVWRGFLVLFGGFYEAMREVSTVLSITGFVVCIRCFK